MELKEYPFYGLGIIAFSVAESDGEIQPRERRELMDLIHDWSERLDIDFDVAEIIFSILKHSKFTEELSYDRGIEYIRKGRDFMSPLLKERFVFLLQDIAHAFPPVTDREKEIIKKFEADLKSI